MCVCFFLILICSQLISTSYILLPTTPIAPRGFSFACTYSKTFYPPWKFSRIFFFRFLFSFFFSVALLSFQAINIWTDTEFPKSRRCCSTSLTSSWKSFDAATETRFCQHAYNRYAIHPGCDAISISPSSLSLPFLSFSNPIYPSFHRNIFFFLSASFSFTSSLTAVVVPRPRSCFNLRVRLSEISVPYCTNV